MGTLKFNGRWCMSTLNSLVFLGSPFRKKNSVVDFSLKKSYCDLNWTYLLDCFTSWTFYSQTSRFSFFYCLFFAFVLAFLISRFWSNALSNSKMSFFTIEAFLKGLPLMISCQSIYETDTLISALQH